MAQPNVVGSYNFASAITLSDTVNILVPSQRSPSTTCDAIYVGSGGGIVAVLQNDATVTLAGAVTGTIIPIAVKRVNSTSTTASSLVALFNI